MTRIIISLVTSVAGIAMLLAGLGIDAWLHAHDETLAAREGIFTLSNPGHVLLGSGMALATGGILAALGFAWEKSAARGIFASRWVRVIGMQVAGAAAVGAVIFAFAASGSGREHNDAGVASASGTAHTHEATTAEVSSDVLEEALATGDDAADAHVDPRDAIMPGAHHEEAANAGQPLVVVPEAVHTHADAPPAVGTASGPDSVSDDMHVHPDGMTMLDSGVPGAAPQQAHPEPTAEERACFADLTTEAKIATARFDDIDVAIAEGYRISEDPAETHMPNRAYMRDGRSLDLAYPESLIYISDASGERRLVGALYKAIKGQGPTPCGNATSWHTHGRCIAADGTFIPESKDKTCPAGYEHHDGAVEMMHLWFVPRRQR